MRCSKFHILLLTIVMPVLLAPGTAQAQYRHKTLLKDRFIHQPVKKQDCTVCHELHFPEAAGQTSKAVPALCFECHTNPARGKKIVHSPMFKGKKCLSCHYPHSAPVKGLLKARTSRLCIGCHNDKKNGVHGQSQLTGDCGLCHDPHASDSRGLLKSASIGQCAACHKTVDKDAYVHSALQEYECQECHNPHRAPPEPVTPCQDCHDEIVSGATVHDAMDEGCSSCHQSHSGPYPNQLNSSVPELCFECHDEMAGGEHAGIDVGIDCSRCHDPHSTKGPGLLLQTAVTATCPSCHVEVLKAPNQHTPVRNTSCKRCHDPHAPGPPQPLVCRDCHPGVLDAKYDHSPAEEDCGNCHDTHGSAFENNLTEAVPALCLGCHLEKKGGNHGRALLGDNCAKCHDPHSALQPGLLTMVREMAECESCHKRERSGAFVHPPVYESECSQCHDPHSDPPTPQTRCIDCHDTLLGSAYVHVAAEEDCSNCHETHSGKFKGLLKTDIHGLCTQCHDDKEMGKHGNTVLGNNCGECHEPHSSARKKLLKVLGDRTCTDCHTEITGKPQQHSALKKFQCSHCHDPHTDPPEMPPVECRRCHLGIADQSPAHGSPSYGRCLECHDPHGSESPSLIVSNAAGLEGDCLDCHKGIKRNLENSRYLHEPLASGDCGDCHTVHEGEAPFTRERFDPRKNVPYDPTAYALCFECHSNATIQVKYTESDTNFRHNRWNLHNLHVVRDGARGFSCRVCHNVHTSRQPGLIEMEIPVNKVYSLKIEYRQTEKGGVCRTNCHTVQEYTR